METYHANPDSLPDACWLLSERCAALSYRPKFVIPVGETSRFPASMTIPSETYGAFVLASHFRVREGTVKPGTIFEHGDMTQA